jgi:hypothetical protein
MHDAFASDAESQLAALKQQVVELESVVAFHRRQGSKRPGNAINGKVPDRPGYSGLTKHAVAEAVLRNLGPTTLPDIVTHLIDTGYGDDRRAVYNGIFTALKRKTDLFEVKGDKWHLKEGHA